MSKGQKLQKLVRRHMTLCIIGKIYKKQGAFLGKHLVFLSKREVLTN